MTPSSGGSIAVGTAEGVIVDLPAALGPVKQDGIAVILQSHDYGEVLAAAAIPVPSNSLIVPH